MKWEGCQKWQKCEDGGCWHLQIDGEWIDLWSGKQFHLTFDLKKNSKLQFLQNQFENKLFPTVEEGQKFINEHVKRILKISAFS